MYRPENKDVRAPKAEAFIVWTQGRPGIRCNDESKPEIRQQAAAIRRIRRLGNNRAKRRIKKFPGHFFRVPRATE